MTRPTNLQNKELNALSLHPPPIPHNTTQHDGSIRNLQNKIETKHHNITIYRVINKFPHVNKWFANTNICHQWCNNLWTSSSLWMLNFPNYWNLDMDNIYMANLQNLLKHNRSPQGNLCLTSQNNTWLHLLATCPNQHLNNLHTS